MKNRTIALSAVAWVAAGAPLASAATSAASFGVRATVVAACTVSPSRWTAGPVCRRTPRHPIPLPAAPVVSFSRDAATGAVVQTVAF